MKLEQQITDAWYKKRRWIYLLSPLELLYKGLVPLRKALYKKGLFKSAHPGIPVIVVGNITVGGTGKTPVVVEIVKHLKKQGWNPGVVSRGYGGSVKQYPFLVEAQTTAKICGDEPVLIYRNTQAKIVIDKNRLRAAEYLKNLGCDIIVTDDGLQHLALSRDYEILVIDGKRGFGNQHLLPVGPLRESIDGIEHCDFVLTNGDNNICPQHRASDCFSITPQYLVDLDSLEKFPLSWLKDKEHHALAGIGNPDRFFSLLRELGSKPICHSFADHHDYKMNDIPNDKKSLVVTEKDAVKLEKFKLLDCLYLKVTADLPQSFYKNLNDFLNQASTKQPKVAS